MKPIEPIPPSKVNTALYLNRWIAVVRERVIGVGETAAQAERAAKQIRPKDKPSLFFVDAAGQLNSMVSLSPDPALWLKNHNLLQQVADMLQGLNVEIYLVGGAVRDLLLGREAVVDLDFAVPDDGLKVARKVADMLGASFYPLDIERKTGRVVYDVPAKNNIERFYLDFATFRGPNLEADLADRDFTINAIALSLNPALTLIDPLGGQQDLERRLIKVVSDNSFRRDPIRVIRAVRQAVDFGFTIAVDTQLLLSRAAALLPLISPERQRDELMKLLNTSRPGYAINLLHRLKALPYIVPEAAAMADVPQSPPHHLDVLNHTTTAMDVWAQMAQQQWPDITPNLRPQIADYLAQMPAGNFSLGQLMPLALLLHDSGKSLTRTEVVKEGQQRYQFIKHEQRSAGLTRKFCKRLRFSNQAQDFTEAVVKYHMRPLMLSTAAKVSRRAVFRFFRDTNVGKYAAGPAVALHALADHFATYPAGQGQAQYESLFKVVDRLLVAYFEEKSQLVNPPLLLSGRDLIDEFALKEGRLIGQILNRLREAQATGHVTDRDQALSFVANDPDFARYQGRDL